MANISLEAITQTAETPSFPIGQHILDVYRAYLEDPAIIPMISNRSYPSIDIINNSPIFKEQFGESTLDMYHVRAFGLGVRNADYAYSYRRGTPEQKIQSCITEFELSYHGENPQFPKGFDQLGSEKLFFILTGRYSDEFDFEVNTVVETLIDNETVYDELRKLYYIGARLELLRKLVRNGNNSSHA